VAERLDGSATSTTGQVLSYLSVVNHLEDFMGGDVATSHVVFYLSLMTAGLFLTYRSIDEMRRRG